MERISEEYSQCLIFESLNGTRYLFDAATCSVHPWPYHSSTDEINLLYSTGGEDLPRLMEQAGVPKSLARYVLSWRRHAGAFGGWLDAASCKSHADVNGSSEKRPPAWKPSPAIFSNLMLIVTDKCNLRCKYCVYSEHYEDFHTYRPLKMSWDTARKAIDHFLELNESPPFLCIADRKLDISFFGGEPLLEGPLIRRVIEYARTCERPQHWIDFSMTTSLTHLPDELAKFLVENKVGIMVSMDGPEVVHDLYRRDAADKGSFSKVYANLEKLYRLDKKYFEERVRAAVTINGNSDLVAMRDFFGSDDPVIPGISFVGLIRDLQNGDFHRHFPYDQERFLAQYYGLLKNYHEEKHKGIPMGEGDFLYELFEQPLLGLYKRMMWTGAAKRSTYTGTCTPGRRIAVDTRGTFHICERVSEDFPIGNVDEGFDLKKCMDAQKRYYAALPNCDQCWARGICQTCFASASSRGDFKFTQRNCNSMRAELAFQLSSLYALLEETPDGLACEDILINRNKLLAQSA